MEVVAWSEKARPVFGRSLPGQGLWCVVEGQAIKGLGRGGRKWDDKEKGSGGECHVNR
jgi:hypothetical protein